MCFTIQCNRISVAVKSTAECIVLKNLTRTQRYIVGKVVCTARLQSVDKLVRRIYRRSACLVRPFYITSVSI